MKPGPKPMPVRVRGVDYESAHHAAEALGVAVKTVWAALSRNELDTLGTGKVRPKCKPFTIGGKTYPSMADASRALGRHKRYVENVLASKSQKRYQIMLERFMVLHVKEEQDEIRRNG